MGRRALLLAIGVAALLAAGCGDVDSGTGSGGPRVVATTTQVADITRQVAGDRAQVDQILEPNADPHDYEPRPSDARDLARARLVVRSGGDLDDWLGDLLDNAGADAPTLTLADAMRTRRVEDSEEADPHWWQDPRNGLIAVRRIRDALTAADPAGRGAYAANARRYAARLSALDRAIATCLGRVAPARRKVVTDHDALGHYADRYGIEVIGTVIPALSTRAQASAGEVAALVRTIERTGVTRIYPESAGNTKLQEAIARESGARVGPGLYADTLGAGGSAGAGYLGSLRANTLALAEGFGLGASRCPLPR